MFQLLCCYSVLSPSLGEVTYSSPRERQVPLCYLMLCIISISRGLEQIQLSFHCKAPLGICSMSLYLRHSSKSIQKSQAMYYEVPEQLKKDFCVSIWGIWALKICLI